MSNHDWPRALRMLERMLDPDCTLKKCGAEFGVSDWVVSVATFHVVHALLNPSWLNIATVPRHDFTSVRERRKHAAFWHRQIAQARTRYRKNPSVVYDPWCRNTLRDVRLYARRRHLWDWMVGRAADPTPPKAAAPFRVRVPLYRIAYDFPSTRTRARTH